jgi:hypothetical protein
LLFWQKGFPERLLVPQDALLVQAIFWLAQLPFLHVCPAVQVVFNWDTVAFEQELETVPGLLQVYVL